jgi:hypothetical protein
MENKLQSYPLLVLTGYDANGNPIWEKIEDCHCSREHNKEKLD